MLAQKYKVLCYLHDWHFKRCILYFQPISSSTSACLITVPYPSLPLTVCCIKRVNAYFLYKNMIRASGFLFLHQYAMEPSGNRPTPFCVTHEQCNTETYLKSQTICSKYKSHQTEHFRDWSKTKLQNKIKNVAPGFIKLLGNEKVDQISNQISGFKEQSWLWIVIDQYVHRSIQNKVTMHQTQSVITTATGHAGQRMAGCLRWQNKKIAKGNQHRQSIATATQTQANQSTYNNARGRGGSGLYRSLGNHCDSDGVLWIMIGRKILGWSKLPGKKNQNSRKENK